MSSLFESQYKTVQRGTSSMGSGATLDVTITTVDVNKCIVFLSCVMAGGSSTPPTLNGIGYSFPNSTTLRLDRLLTTGSGAPPVHTVYWQILEWY